MLLRLQGMLAHLVDYSQLKRRCIYGNLGGVADFSLLRDWFSSRVTQKIFVRDALPP